MSNPRADVALLVDFADLRRSLCVDEATPSEGSTDDATPVEAAAPQSVGPSAADVARDLVRFSGRIGRLAIARAYADWSRCAELAADIGAAHLEPVLVPATRDGEDRSHIRLVVDALEALYVGDEPDAYVLVTGDATLLPLVQRLKADGSEVVIVGTSNGVPEDLRASADRFYAIEDVFEGAEAEPARPRTWRGARAGGGHETDGRARAHGAGQGQAPRRSQGSAANGGRRDPARPAHPTPIHSGHDFDQYDWGPFLRLVDELERRLPFVGVRYLVNKVLGAHNCGVEDARLKRDLINRAVDDGLIEMYPVGNVGDRADPVTACRISRASARVVDVLGETSPPSPPEEHEANGDAEDEHP